MLYRSNPFINTGSLTGSWCLFHLITIWVVGVCHENEVAKCLDLMPECEGPDCYYYRYEIYVSCKRVIKTIQAVASAPRCPIEELSKENWSGCQQGNKYKQYVMDIGLKYFDLVCCLEGICTSCEDKVANSLCEATPESGCDFDFFVEDQRYRRVYMWKSPDDKNKYGEFKKESLRVNVDSNKVKLKFVAQDRDGYHNEDDLILNDSIYLQPVYSCKKGGKRFINDDWLAHRDNKEVCVTLFHPITDATKKKNMEEKWYHYAQKFDIFLRTLWNQKIINHKIVTKG